MVLGARLQVPICGARLGAPGGSAAVNAWRPATSSTANTCWLASLTRTDRRRSQRRPLSWARCALEDADSAECHDPGARGQRMRPLTGKEEEL